MKRYGATTSSLLPQKCLMPNDWMKLHVVRPTVHRTVLKRQTKPLWFDRRTSWMEFCQSLCAPESKLLRVRSKTLFNNFEPYCHWRLSINPKLYVHVWLCVLYNRKSKIISWKLVTFQALLIHPALCTRSCFACDGVIPSKTRSICVISVITHDLCSIVNVATFIDSP